MTRQDFQLIADAVRLAKRTVEAADLNAATATASVPYDAGSALALVTIALAHALAANNPLFHWEKFMDACSVSGDISD